VAIHLEKSERESRGAITLDRGATLAPWILTCCSMLAHTAVVAMDCQAGIVSIYAKPPEEFAERASLVLRAARAAGWR